jgi:hypothetical protein
MDEHAPQDVLVHATNQIVNGKDVRVPLVIGCAAGIVQSAPRIAKISVNLNEP